MKISREQQEYNPQKRVKLKDPSEWKKLKSYVKENKQAYFLKYLVKTAGKDSKVEEERFQSLFKSMQANFFYNNNFLPAATEVNTAAGYIKADVKVRDFDLIIFWKNVHEQNPMLNLPAFAEAKQVRQYIKGNCEAIAKVTHLCMRGIFESWSDWANKYGQELGLPNFENERDMHNYLENSQNTDIIKKMVVKENAAILEKTSRLPPEIENFTGLKTLTFSNRKSWVIPKSIYQLKELTELNLDHSELRKVSKRISELKNANIRFVGTQLKTLPSTVRLLDLNRVIIQDKEVNDPLKTLVKG